MYLQVGADQHGFLTNYAQNRNRQITELQADQRQRIKELQLEK